MTTSPISLPQYKSEKWLHEQGWSRGQGLGVNLQGRTDFVRVSKKDDAVAGIGSTSYQTFDFSHWDKMYNDAAKTLEIRDDGEGVAINNAPKEEKKVISPYMNMFVKASPANQTMSVVKEEDLFHICGKRELRLLGQRGKEQRLRDFENGVLNYQEVSRDVPVSSKKRRSKKEKKKSKEGKKETTTEAKKKKKEKKTKRSAAKQEKEMMSVTKKEKEPVNAKKNRRKTKKRKREEDSGDSRSSKKSKKT